MRRQKSTLYGQLRAAGGDWGQRARAASQDVDRARADRDQACHQVNELERQLQQARQDTEHGEHALKEAQARAREADKAVRGAERDVQLLGR